MSAQVIHNQSLSLRLDAAVLVDAVQQIGGTDIRGHNQNRVLKVHGPSLRIGDTSVVQYL